ncbi:hypothetical protein L1987_43055 [Smallanthus sonchifolius]|uniref:Uncharacterized protein n=2 Tax=Smallanthus sonchifolius TaxID=185202 RepID=A0ACB9GKK4_9ASTR|nr:hypothetical protein L1987_43053 [Smallanthus sonchifolius]KAI3783964.1 hypothetical protein L1987_43055 [Smallanthus sonchifolius]
MKDPRRAEEVRRVEEVRRAEEVRHAEELRRVEEEVKKVSKDIGKFNVPSTAGVVTRPVSTFCRWFGTLLALKVDGIPTKLGHFVVDSLDTEKMQLICCMHDKHFCAFGVSCN